MGDAPERILIEGGRPSFRQYWYPPGEQKRSEVDVEYIRADLCPPQQKAEPESELYPRASVEIHPDRVVIRPAEPRGLDAGEIVVRRAAPDGEPVEGELLQVIDERDAAEDALGDMYHLVTGRHPEWSNNFDYADAVQDVRDMRDVETEPVEGEVGDALVDSLDEAAHLAANDPDASAGMFVDVLRAAADRLRARVQPRKVSRAALGAAFEGESVPVVGRRVLRWPAFLRACERLGLHIEDDS